MIASLPARRPQTSSRTIVAAVAVASAALVSCAPGQAAFSRQAQNAREQLVGMHREELLRCAGRPQHVERRGRWEFIDFVSGSPAPGSGRTQCIVSVKLQGGYVESVDYESPNGGLIGQSAPECLYEIGRAH